MSSEVGIRPFEARDRAAVREICCETADRGRPAREDFCDRALLADVITRYYTDFEPQCAWVAEADGRVIGYLTGALNTDRANRMLFARVAPRAVGRALVRGVLWRRSAWRLLAGMAITAVKLIRADRPSLAGYPAHLHVDIRDGYRGQHVGARLVAPFLRKLDEAHIPGVHATVRSDNPGARGFFERLGFSALGEHTVVLPMEGTLENVAIITYGKRIGPTRA